MADQSACCVVGHPAVEMSVKLFGLWHGGGMAASAGRFDVALKGIRRH